MPHMPPGKAAQAVITDREARQELVPLKRRFGWSKDDLDDYARVIEADRRADKRDLKRAVTTALALPTSPAIHELMGLMHQERRDYQERASRASLNIEEGDFVKGHDCHKCGGNVEFREPFLWCPECNAAQQVGHTIEGYRRFQLNDEERRQMEVGEAHEWPHTPEEAQERVRQIVASLTGSMDMNARLAEPLPGEDAEELIEELQEAA